MRNDVWNNVASNDWPKSSLYNHLNTTYYNSINETYRNMIANGEWQVGMPDDYTITASEMYEYEKKKVVTGYVGLLNAADYGYASKCYKTHLLSQYGLSFCIDSGWLNFGGNRIRQWLITPFAGEFKALYVDSDYLSFGSVTVSAYCRPVMYLKPNVYIKSGTGTYLDPFILILD